MFKFIKKDADRFRFGRKSLKQLKGVHPDMVRVVHHALSVSEVDFSVFEGLRSQQRQNRLYRAGVSKTLNSRHITGHAVDLVPYINGKVVWHWPAVHKIAQAMITAAIEEDVHLEWGAAWDRDMRDLSQDTEHEMMLYGRRRRDAGRKPFFDGVHFQLSRKVYP